MKKLALIIAAIAAITTLTGCKAIENVSESVKEKNIAAGSDTTGGNVELGLSSENLYVPNISLWFGRRRVWYASLKKDADVSQMPAIIKAGNQQLNLNAGATGVGVTQGSEDAK